MTRRVNDWNCNHAPMETRNVHLFVLHHERATIIIIINSQCNSIGVVISSCACICGQQTDRRSWQWAYSVTNHEMQAKLYSYAFDVVCLSTTNRLHLMHFQAHSLHFNWGYYATHRSRGCGRLNSIQRVGGSQKHIHVRIWYHSWRTDCRSLP